MRDILITAIVLISLPYIVKKPAIGILMWVWISLMNPHRLAFGFAHDLQFAALIALFIFIGLFFTREPRRFPVNGLSVTLIFFMVWISFTSVFAIHPEGSYDMWSRVMKIFLMTLIAMAVIYRPEHLKWMLWIIVGSIGYYSVKGGLFAVVNGGHYTVWGPEGSFIGDNNSLALAVVMIIPLMLYLRQTLTKPWQRNAMSAAMLLSTLSAVASYSRGALLALFAMGVMLWWKSRNKGFVAIAAIIAGIVVLMMMPPDWFNRMDTIATYDEDASAMGRINAWQMAFNLATNRVIGGGFEIYEPDVFARYAPNPLDIHAAHSIYFQVLGEQGFLGLFLFLILGGLTWTALSESKRLGNRFPEGRWIGPMADMIKVSMVGYAVGGAFLSLSYFDLPYYLMVIAVVMREWVRAEAKHKVVATPATRGFGRVKAEELDEPMSPAVPVPSRSNAFGNVGRAFEGANR